MASGQVVVGENSPEYHAWHQSFWSCSEDTIAIPVFILFQLKIPTTISVQCSCSVASNSLWPYGSMPGFPVHHNYQSLLKLMSNESVMPSSHLILCSPLLLLPSIFPSIRVFSNESVFPIRWPKYWSFSFSIIPSEEHSWLISFRMDRLDLLAVQGTLRSLFQHHSLKASSFWHSA